MVNRKAEKTQEEDSNNTTGKVIRSTIEGIADAVLVDGIIKNLDEVKHVTVYIPPLGPAAKVSTVASRTGIKTIKGISKIAGPIAAASYG
jgi:hypothetical protein